MVDCSVDDLREIALLLSQDSQNGVKAFLLNQLVRKPINESNAPESQSDPHSSERASQYSDVEIVSKRSKRSNGCYFLSRDSEEMETPITLALKNSCWK